MHRLICTRDSSRLGSRTRRLLDSSCMAARVRPKRALAAVVSSSLSPSPPKLVRKKLAGAEDPRNMFTWSMSHMINDWTWAVATPPPCLEEPSTVNGETTRIDPTRSEDSAEWSFIFVRLGPCGPPLPPEKSLRGLPAGGRRAPLKHNFSIVSSLLDASEPV